MFSSAQNFRNFDSTSDNSHSAMTKRSAAAASETVKEFVVRTFDELDMTNFAVTQRGQSKDDRHVFSTSYDHQKLVMNLTPGKPWLKLAWPIQTSTYAQKEEGNTETLRVQVEVGEAMAKVILELEEAVKLKVEAAIPDVKWLSSVKTLEGRDVFTAKLVWKAPNEKHLTHCIVRPFQKEVVKVVGKELLEPLLVAQKSFARSKLKMVVALHSVWTMEDKQENDKFAQQKPAGGKNS